MNTESKKLMLASDYQEGAHPNIIRRLTETNLLPTTGYGTDEICESAREKIRQACKAPNAGVHFLVGGTQTNATVIDALLKSYQGVISPDSGHINVHESGAIEFGGHKVLSLPGTLGKISAEQIDSYIKDFYNDGNYEHMVMPGMVYISQSTEYGTIYSLQELKEISAVCREHKIPLFLDGARLAYALASPENDVTLEDFARLCDVFYIGGTKCGALFGEAVVIPNPDLIPNFVTIIKQHGGLLAKGRLLGIQFDELFSVNEQGELLYEQIGHTAIGYAQEIKQSLSKNGLELYFDSPTNQVFFIIENSKMKKLSEKAVFSFGEKYDDSYSVIRFATSWATKAEDVQELKNILDSI